MRCPMQKLWDVAEKDGSGIRRSFVIRPSGQAAKREMRGVSETTLW